MAHFAQLDENNTVIQVIVVHNNELMLDGEENETRGIVFCKSLFGEETRWKQTSYNGTFRKNYAGFGYTYDATRDAFIPPQPYNSWTLNETTCQWESPIPYPDDDLMYQWDEEQGDWAASIFQRTQP
jgi:hypothetical protein